MTEQKKTIDSEDLNLAGIFNDFYVVPSFQREYVWEEEQVEQLLQDIYDEFTDDGQVSEYFIGSIVVCPGQGNVLELIDGQQRMTTAYIFLCAARDYLARFSDKPVELLNSQIAATSVNDDGEEIFRYRVDLQYEDSADVLKEVAERSIAPEDEARFPKTRSVTNILSAYRLILTFFENEFAGDIAALRKFYAYFINRVKLVRIKTESVAHALKVFETINDRGVGLDSMDLLKNLMFMRAKKREFDQLKDKWKDLVDTLYGANEKPLRFLRYFIFARYNVDRLKEDQIYSWFAKNEERCGYSTNPMKFVEMLREAAHAYVNFVQGKNLDGSINRYLLNLHHLSGSARQHLILLLASYHHLSTEDFTELCRQLENLFFAYIITREPTKEFERNFARWAPEVQQITNRAELDQFIRSRFRPAKENLATRYRLAFEELRTTSIQQYRLRYVLAKMTQYVNERAYGTAFADLSMFINRKVHIEHILPQSPSPEVISEFDRPEEIPDYVNRLGNLTLIESSINCSVGNGLFAAKREAYAKSQFLLTSTIAGDESIGVDTAIDRAIQGLLSFADWSSESIEIRQTMLADLAERVWDMPS